VAARGAAACDLHRLLRQRLDAALLDERHARAEQADRAMAAEAERDAALEQVRRLHDDRRSLVGASVLEQQAGERAAVEAAELRAELDRVRGDLYRARSLEQRARQQGFDAGCEMMTRTHSNWCSLVKALREALAHNEKLIEELKETDVRAAEWLGILEKMERERDESRAEVERLKGEIDWLTEGARQEEQRLALLLDDYEGLSSADLRAELTQAVRGES